MPRRHNNIAGRENLRHIIAVQRNPHLFWCFAWGHPRQGDGVERKAHRIGSRLVDIDDPPLNRAIIAKADHWLPDSFTAVFCDSGPRTDQTYANEKRSNSNPHNPRDDQK